MSYEGEPLLKKEKNLYDGPVYGDVSLNWWNIFKRFLMTQDSEIETSFKKTGCRANSNPRCLYAKIGFSKVYVIFFLKYFIYLGV